MLMELKIDLRRLSVAFLAVLVLGVVLVTSPVAQEQLWLVLPALAGLAGLGAGTGAGAGGRR
ncbi:hypothetical protein ACIA8F_33845 [Streptomyces sp. NPDC051563]|uniref:hypothetical protein n=1 Tax=Streptomyces sp. NPDC051563 TaxID=3365659 RepID=UPI0037BD1C58